MGAARRAFKAVLWRLVPLVRNVILDPFGSLDSVGALNCRGENPQSPVERAASVPAATVDGDSD